MSAHYYDVSDNIPKGQILLTALELLYKAHILLTC
jgi:hypothetical protein